MNFPLNAFHDLGLDAGLIVSLFVGIGFGFMLERGGFGSSKVLAGIFYGRDWRVLKVMFTAIVTAMVGLYSLHGLGYLALDQIAFKSTYLWGQILGGLLLGIGFVTAGYCPGTSVVGAASGKLDALFVIPGLIIGIGIFEEGYSLWSGVYGAGYMGEVSISQWSGIPIAWVGLGVAVMAFGAFAAVEYFERGKSIDALKPWIRRAGVPILAGGLLVMALQLVGPGESRAMNALGQSEYLPTTTPIELASFAVEERSNVMTVDLRPEGASPALPGAYAIDPEVMIDLRRRPALPKDRLIVIADSADDGKGRQVAAALIKSGYQASVLAGGADAFRSAVLDETALDPRAVAYRLRISGESAFGGAAPPPPTNKKAPPKRKKKKSTGCS